LYDILLLIILQVVFFGWAGSSSLRPLYPHIHSARAALPGKRTVLVNMWVIVVLPRFHGHFIKSDNAIRGNRKSVHSSKTLKPVTFISATVNLYIQVKP